MAELNYKAMYEQAERQIEVLNDIIDQCKEVTSLEKCIQCDVNFWPRRSNANNDYQFCSPECEDENKREAA